MLEGVLPSLFGPSLVFYPKKNHWDGVVERNGQVPGTRVSDTREQKVPLFPKSRTKSRIFSTPPPHPTPKKEKLKKGKRRTGEREEKRVLNGRSPAEGRTEARLNGFQEAR